MAHAPAPLAAPRLIVYDLDGTLVDAFVDIWRGVNHALRANDLPDLPFEQVKNYVGDGAVMLIRRCLGEALADRFDDVFPLFADFYVNDPQPSASPYPGVLETLARLRELGVRQAVLSNKPHAVTVLTLERLGLAPLLDGIWGEEPSRPRKPAPESLQLVMQTLGAQPAETWMVGDGPADQLVAAAAGTSFVAVSYGLLSRERLAALHPAAILDLFSELLPLATPQV